MSQKPFAVATERNSQAILGVLREEFQGATSILEIGSGTGQHAVYFGAELEWLEWQTSDVADNHDGIKAWIRDAALPNVHLPLELDVRNGALESMAFDGIFSANTAHIMGSGAVASMFSLVAGAMRSGAKFVLYGPFRREGRFNTPSNEQFHESLRQRDADMGIRDLEEMDRLAASGGLVRRRLYAMPANNHVAVWVKNEDSRQ